MLSAFPPREVLVNNLFRRLRALVRPSSGGRPGLAEALVWAGALDALHRYRVAWAAVEGDRRPGGRVLEVGPGWWGLAFFLPRHVALVQVEPEARPLRGPVGEEARVRGSGLALPFRTGAFDVAVALDVMEHLAPPDRPRLAEELKRVARRAVVLHAPLQSEDGTFEAAAWDRVVQERRVATTGRGDPNLEEHLAHGHPSPEELLVCLPGATIEGTESVEDWLRYVLRGHSPFRQLGPALRLWRDGPGHGPPFYGGLLVWRWIESVERGPPRGIT